MKERGSPHVREIFERELRKDRREIFWRNSFFFLSLLTALLLLFLFVSSLATITGQVASVEGRAGYITYLEVEGVIPVTVWSGLYGFALRVPGISEQFSETLDGGEIDRSDIFFDCIQQDAPGGPEIYASTSPSLDFSDVTPASHAAIDTFINCTNHPTCANNTFTETTSLFVGETNISGIPSTFTYKFDGNNTVFVIGALNVSGNLTFFTKIESVQKGFSSNITVNYQMLLPIPGNTSQQYYFFSDPNDLCPPGGIGNSVNASLAGYILDQGNNTIENATVTVAGESALSNASGFYNVSFTVLEGNYNVIVQKDGYNPTFGNVTVSFSNTSDFQNFTLVPEEQGETVSPRIYGVVRNNAGTAIADVNITAGNMTAVSNSSGQYSFKPIILIGRPPIFAVKSGYDNYIAFLNITSSTTEVEHNITLEESNLDNVIGDSTDDGSSDKDADFDEIQELAEELGQDFWVSTDKIDIQVRRNTFVEQEVAIYNFKTTTMNVLFTLSPELSDFVELDKSSLTLSSSSSGALGVTIFGTRPIGIYEGTITLGGDLDQEIPVRIQIVDRRLPIETLLLKADLLRNVVRPGGLLKYRLNLQNLLSEQSYQVTLKQSVLGEDGTERFAQGDDEDVEIENSLTLLREIALPEDIPEGRYLLNVNAQFFSLFLTTQEPFLVANPFYLYSFFGIPLWIILVIISALCFILFNFFMYKRYVNKKKRYRLALNLNLLPKDGPRSIKIGKIAETNVPAFYDLDMFTTHAIIAGATGGGKSIAAQVLIEEALQKNIAVIVFDPTAQWSGMLRKCEDKKMMAFYPKFGLKPSDAKAFPGNVRQVTNERQKIDIRKFINPGQIQVFTLNKLDPAQMDVFVAGVIAEIFRSDPKEHPGLQTMLVFDEVHRLLPKFGGSGKGFLQIERACREFRKWGLGVMLVSQVLSDFVGEIKANINTEMQMRVAEENDLARIKERYGLDALKSLVRADIGVGMFQNAEYNRGLPYFVNLRPILHSTRRLSDEVLEKYNKYGETIDDLEYQIEQLESEKVDTFDLKMELKLVKDKLMTGNFTVVDIYLEGLQPRLAKQWETLGKKPKKKEIELVDLKAMEESLAAAQKDRNKWNKKQGGGAAATEEKKEVKADPAAKIVKPITFDNGMMVSSLNELKDVLPNLDDSVFAIHVTAEKNDIADWAGKEIDAGLGAELKKVSSKDAMLKTIGEFGKKDEKKEGGDKKEGGGEEKKEGEKEKGKEEKSEKNEEVGGEKKEGVKEGEKAEVNKEDAQEEVKAEDKKEEAKEEEKTEEKKEGDTAKAEGGESGDAQKNEGGGEKKADTEKKEAPQEEGKTEEKQSSEAEKQEDTKTDEKK